MSRARLFFLLIAVLFVVLPRAEAAELDGLVSSLKNGGYVIVFRHGATDDSQKDVFPFKFDDMSAQRQLNEKGRNTAREIGAALKKLGVPIGDVYTSRLHRAVETGKLIGGKEVSPTDALTDSSSGSASGMANPDGKNAKAGRAVRELVDAAPKAGLNNLAITHKTNVTDAFGKDFADIRESEALIYKTSVSGPAVFVMRVQAGQWVTLAGS
ncbi:histidine phosphatase family protein [Bradyrhizobium sp. AUGA SZCCT0160]|uniref:histidine phosphatase family protein n=1 Tax=Bradyrhizobium sp. AUGA SZCCT0160 TaxID=2807662 RepID=UPI00201393CD|nr:histidine phosphatase family protein [Bradyrhizobium sp. AUGA SZCCT0160]